MRNALEFDHATVLSERDGGGVTPRHVLVDYKVNAPELVRDAIPEGTPMEEVGDRVDMLLGSVENPVDDVTHFEPVTVVRFSDGSKVGTRCSEDDTYDPRLGDLICAFRKATKNRGSIDAEEGAMKLLLNDMADEEALALSQVARFCAVEGHDPTKVGSLLTLAAQGWDMAQLADTLLLYAAIREAE